MFGNQWPPLVHDFVASDWNISSTIQQFWANLATSGDPNVGSAAAPPVRWPRYGPADGGDTNINLDVPLSTTAGLLDGLCDMWDQVASSLGPDATATDADARAEHVARAHRRFFKTPATLLRRRAAAKAAAAATAAAETA